MTNPAETGDTDILDKCLMASGPVLWADISEEAFNSNKSKLKRSINMLSCCRVVRTGERNYFIYIIITNKAAAKNANI